MSTQISDRKKEKIRAIYEEYVKEIMNVSDIKRWSTRKTLSSTMADSPRANETRVMDAIEGTDYREGDRFYTFFEEEDKICLVENFKGVYSKDRLLKKLYSTAEIFETVLPVKSLFLNYTLKRNKKALEELIK